MTNFFNLYDRLFVSNRNFTTEHVKIPGKVATLYLHICNKIKQKLTSRKCWRVACSWKFRCRAARVQFGTLSCWGNPWTCNRSGPPRTSPPACTSSGTWPPHRPASTRWRGTFFLFRFLFNVQFTKVKVLSLALFCNLVWARIWMKTKNSCSIVEFD